MKTKALVLLSGGQDSATCLAIAQNAYDELITLSFNYGQKHHREIECAEGLSKRTGAYHITLNIAQLFRVPSALLNSAMDINDPHPLNPELPGSFVPGRNIIFLSVAASIAYSKRCQAIYCGVSQTDYSGYPDCREGFMIEMEPAIQYGLDSPIELKTPLLYLSKAETVMKMSDLGKLHWYKYTHTCYNNERPPCGNCPACKLREKGFTEAHIIDPLTEV